MRPTWLLSLLLAVAPAAAQEALPPGDDGIREMEAVVVSGVLPGPGLWKVHHGEHTLHILGTVSPLPRRMEWRSDEVATVLEQADAVLGPPGVVVGSDIGRLRGLTLLPSALRARNNPDGQTLQEVLPEDVHARWLRVKAQHVGRDRGIEKRRPLFAAMELYDKAISRAGLGGRVISPVVNAALKRRRMKSTPTMLQLTIDNPREALADYRGEALRPEDIECFSRMLDIVERDLPRMVVRANAWATGDIEALRALPTSPTEACLSAWSGSEAARKHGIADVDVRIRERWMEVAVEALGAHRTVFATAPVAELLRPGGYLSMLEAKGYRIESP